MSRWVVVLDHSAAVPRYWRRSGWVTPDVTVASVFGPLVADDIARVLRLSGYPRANVAELPPTQPAQTEGDPTAHGTR